MKRFGIGLLIIGMALVIFYYTTLRYMPSSVIASFVASLRTLPPSTLFMVGVLIVLYILLSGQNKGPRTTSHGSARFATWREARQYAFPAKWQQARIRRQGRTPKSWFVLGRYKGITVALSEKQQESGVLIVGPTGQGKSAGLIIPSILREEGSRSMVITDPKGELFNVTAGAVAEHHTVSVFAPTMPATSDCYNPLAYIDRFEDAQEFAICWVKNTGEDSESFWINNAILLIIAIVLHIRATEPDAPFSSLGDIIMESSFEHIKDMLQTSPSKVVRRTAAKFLENVSLNERLAGSILTDLANRFLLLQSPEVRSVTARHEIDFNKMVDHPLALYLSVPHSAAKRFYPLTSCMMMQLFKTLERQAERAPNGELPRGIACYMDEFANIGRVHNMGGYATTIRSKRVALTLAIQTFSQLQDVYGEKESDTIISNCLTKIILPGAGQNEIEYFSRRIGDTTVQTHSRNQSANGGGSSEGWTQSETSRRLMTPDEIRRMKKRTLLMLTDVLAPMVIKNTWYFFDRTLRQWVNLPYQHRQTLQQTQILPDELTRAQRPPQIQQSMQSQSAQDKEDKQEGQQDQFFSPS